ncbi:hypothetical protein BDZ85DRAFT_259305 [Elsinoe ampelina]|uniref:Stress-response A/B barrel domain-containing protein n=1 Tax=Elsinoe ampelina TaxID=302913 RepID=A0A6A6GGS3_9PEZI|nr:hypothetical protein BDZ85DRAFT_259305 [Elsinoe ampelina]
MPVNRVTLFKIPDTDSIPSMLEQLSTLKQDAKKDGKPYLVRAVAGQTAGDPRAQGYTLCLSTSFASLEDMKYYDEADEAHSNIKSLFKGKVEAPPLMVYMDNVVGS